MRSLPRLPCEMSLGLSLWGEVSLICFLEVSLRLLHRGSLELPSSRDVTFGEDGWRICGSQFRLAPGPVPGVVIPAKAGIQYI